MASVKNLADILIALDGGHGTDTKGKGVPSMKEYEFNHAVVKYAKPLLEKQGFKVLLTQPINGKDVPLKARTDLANAKKADLFVSIHADANPNKDAYGHWGFYWQGSKEGETLAKYWYEEIDKIKPKDRNGSRKNQASHRQHKWANFHVLRETSMPAVLMEHAFMTNDKDLALLKSDKFRKDCAVALTKALCRYYGATYKEDKPVVVKPAPKPVAKPKPKPTAKPAPKPVAKPAPKPATNEIHRVQVGAFGDKANAEKLLKDLEKLGIKGIIKTEKK